MGEVKKNSSINITRRIGSSVENLSNKLFNGYIYNMSLDVGYNGAATVLTLNLALNRTINQVKLNKDVISDRKKDIKRVKNLVATQKTVPLNYVGNTGNSGAGTYIGAQNQIAQISDKDFNIDPNYIGTTCSYDIAIYDPLGNPTYNFRNFKIVTFSISKKNDQKILTLALKDNSFVLDKVFVGLLGQEIAIDYRSETDALVSGITISCPQIGTTCKAGTVTLNNLRQSLHFSNKNFKNNFYNQLGIGKDKNYSNINISAGDEVSTDKANYVVISSKDANKSIYKGYGAVIILGEEEFKDAPCAAAEVSYSFDTFLKAIKKLGITITENDRPASAPLTVDYSSIKDKSAGKLKKSFHGTLRQVLNQWCEEFGYSYCIDFTKSSSNAFVIKGIDLSSSLGKEKVLSTKLALEDLEASSSNSTFVVKSEDFSYDLSQQKLKLYSSYYFKDAKEKTITHQNDLGNKAFYSINLQNEFPQLFGSGMGNIGVGVLGSNRVRDFSGAYRSYEQVLTSAILGKHSPRLREIYNYSIGAYQALGFVPFYGDSSASRVPLPADNTLIFSEAISHVLEYQSQNLFHEDGSPCYDMSLGFYNEELARTVLELESFIADFVGKYYWTDAMELRDGEYGNENYYAKYEVTSSAPVQKVLVGQLYNLDVFKKARYLIQSVAAVFSTGTTQYFNAYASLSEASSNITNICNQAAAAYTQLKGDNLAFKKFRFFHERSSASYGIYQEFINDIQNLKVSIAGNTTAAPELIDLGQIYSPTFKEMSPVSLGLLQAALPIDISKVALGSFKFGVLIGVIPYRQIFDFKAETNKPNQIEIQNSVYSRCAELLKINTSGRPSTAAKNKKSCSKTLLYETCVKPCEVASTEMGIDDTLNFVSGPSPYSCFRVKIHRYNTKFLDNFVLGQLFRPVSSNGSLSLEAMVNNQSLVSVSSLRAAGNMTYPLFKKTDQFESITAPSAATYKIRVVSTTTSETFMPFKNYILGGVESPDDLLKILNNENFSLDLNVNNITPNVRELFGDETNPSFINAPVDLTRVADYPTFIQYQGYNGDNPAYEFSTFYKYHEALKTYYDSASRSLSEPSVKFSADIFCSEISSELKGLLTVDNGLTKLNINLAENGLNINCSFDSYPASLVNLETLINKNKPNIKLLNTNYFQ